MKTLWQTVYSFLGFWTYTVHENDRKAYRTLCWFGFGRNFDLIKWKIQSVYEQALELKEKAFQDKNPTAYNFAAKLIEDIEKEQS